MKVGILGTGDVGRSLGKGFIGLGHDVMMGSREPSSEKVRQWVTEAGSRASSGTFAESGRIRRLGRSGNALEWHGERDQAGRAEPARGQGDHRRHQSPVLLG